MKDTTKATILLQLQDKLDNIINLTHKAKERLENYQRQGDNTLMGIAAQDLNRHCIQYDVVEEIYNDIRILLTEEN